MTRHTLLIILVCSIVNLNAQKFIAEYNKGKYVKALKLADKAIDDNGKNFDAYLYKSLSYMHLGSEDEFREEYPFGIESSISTLRFLNNKDKEKAYIPSHQQQTDSIISTASDYVFKLYEQEKYTRVEKMIDKLIELSPKPEYYYLKGKLLEEEGDNVGALKAFNAASAKIYLDYKKGIIPEPYLFETFIALANSLSGEYEFRNASIIYCRALDIFKVPEVEESAFNFLANAESSLSAWSPDVRFNEFINCADSIMSFVQDKTMFDNVKWSAIIKYYEMLGDNYRLESADSLMMAQGCGISNAKYYLLTRILVNTRSVYNLQQNKVADARNDFNIFIKLLNCNSTIAQNEMIVSSIVDSFITAGDFINASKLIYNLQLTTQNKSNAAFLEDKLYNAIDVLPDSQVAAVDLYQIFQYFPNNKKLKALQQNASLLAIEKLIRDKKFTQAGEMLRKQSHLYPNDASLKSLYKIWAIEDYRVNYIGSEIEYSSLGWTGNYDNCDPGEISVVSNQKLIQRLDYLRRLAGLPDQSELRKEWNEKCQEAALMMAANGRLSHFPPEDWKCYTKDGASGAGNSNLALGASDVDGLMLELDDDGLASVGHRRWILNPYRKVFGHGSNGTAMALWALGGKDADYPESVTEKFETTFVAWPPEGYVPMPLRCSYWSFALENCDFGKATVEMWQGKTKIECDVLPQEFGYGQNTLVWVPALNLSSYESEVAYTVVIKNVAVFEGGQYSGNSSYTIKDFTYTVSFIPVSGF